MKKALVVMLMLTLMASTGIVFANPPANAVSGTFQTQSFSGPGCSSPVGLCSQGVATGDLSGNVLVVITSSVVTVDANGVPFSEYTGTILISDNKGDFSGTINGSINLNNGNLNSTVALTDGTRKYQNRTGTLTVNGFFDLATGAELDNYNGTVQLNPPGQQ
jgi:hypothetical protein